MALGAPAVLTQDSDTTDGTTFTTASVAPGADQVLILACVNGSGANSPPSGITGLGLTWTPVANVENNYCAASVWTANTTTAPTPGALTITYPAAMQAAHWHLFAFDGAAAAIPQSAVYPSGGGTGQDQDPAYSLPAAPAAGSGVLMVAAINSDTATLSPQGGFAAVGTSQSTTATNLRSTMMWDATGPQAVSYGTTAAAPRKASVAIEVAEAAAGVTPHWFYDNGAAWVDVTGQVHYDNGATWTAL